MDFERITDAQYQRYSGWYKIESQDSGTHDDNEESKSISIDIKASVNEQLTKHAKVKMGISATGVWGKRYTTLGSDTQENEHDQDDLRVASKQSA